MKIVFVKDGSLQNINKKLCIGIGQVGNAFEIATVEASIHTCKWKK